jgi:hypothetical protein
MPANDKQVGGTHYQSTIQPWDFVLANGLGFLEGNAVKYITRHKKTKTGKQDLEKAIHYLQKAIEFYYSTPAVEEKKLANAAGP